jgi:hypothetical protein
MQLQLSTCYLAIIFIYIFNLTPDRLISGDNLKKSGSKETTIVSNEKPPPGTFSTGTISVNQIPCDSIGTDSDHDGMPNWWEEYYFGQVIFKDDFDKRNLDTVQWKMKRTWWEVKKGRLYTVPKALPHFNYGHGGNGRKPLIMLHEGDPSWVDYSFQYTCGSLGVSPDFNPYRLPSNHQAFGSYFRAISVPASWNAPARTAYRETFNPNKKNWLLSGSIGFHMSGKGYNWSNKIGGSWNYVTGNSEVIKEDVNTVYVVVKGNKMWKWINGTFMGEATDSLNVASYGGIGLMTHWEAMGWFDDVEVREVGLNPQLNDAACDYDGDGFSNLEEYQNCTNPLVWDFKKESF